MKQDDSERADAITSRIDAAKSKLLARMSDLRAQNKWFDAEPVANQALAELDAAKQAIKDRRLKDAVESVAMAMDLLGILRKKGEENADLEQIIQRIISE